KAVPQAHREGIGSIVGVFPMNLPGKATQKIEALMQAVGKTQSSMNQTLILLIKIGPGRSRESGATNINISSHHIRKGYKHIASGTGIKLTGIAEIGFQIVLEIVADVPGQGKSNGIPVIHLIGPVPGNPEFLASVT